MDKEGSREDAIFFFFFVMLRIELRDFRILGKNSTIELHLQNWKIGCLCFLTTRGAKIHYKGKSEYRFLYGPSFHKSEKI